MLNPDLDLMKFDQRVYANCVKWRNVIVFYTEANGQGALSQTVARNVVLGVRTSTLAMAQLPYDERSEYVFAVEKFRNAKKSLAALADQCFGAQNPLVKLQLQAEERGVVSIKGVNANRFLAMKEDGRLLALKCATEECFFFERLESNNYNTYRSRKYSDWYVALKRTGQYKPGPKTGPGQKAILFLPMSAKS
ncbi:PREDICTED: fibroblast growth factor 2-like [Nestor notabilis]|uniref:fibroblast growth factor 2-like n=1 Tax=Nestor notabilis TaxID=176057 RepID=UPI000523A6D2|nr:PREDICTED: fibroblast growth factor 2-like [Nestor notabilis]